LPKPRRRSIGREILLIRQSLAAITRSLGRLGPAIEAAAAGARKAPEQTGRKLRLSAERRAALKLQGQYMGYLRGLKPGQKVRVKALRAAKGVRPAIAFAKRLAKR
jgi:hypothetical protein